MKTIWKWTLSMKAQQVLQMPAGAEILCAQNQSGDITLWAMCDPEQPMQPRGIRVIGTGHAFNGDPGRYIGTVQVASGAFVWHVFETPIQ